MSVKDVPEMDYRPIQGVSPPFALCFQDRLRIYHDPDENKAATEDE